MGVSREREESSYSFGRYTTRCCCSGSGDGYLYASNDYKGGQSSRGYWFCASDDLQLGDGH